jgi:hypothetical protein
LVKSPQQIRIDSSGFADLLRRHIGSVVAYHAMRWQQHRYERRADLLIVEVMCAQPLNQLGPFSTRLAPEAVQKLIVVDVCHHGANLQCPRDRPMPLDITSSSRNRRVVGRPVIAATEC